MKLEVKKIGNSTGLILPKELMARLNLARGRLAVRDRAAGGRGPADAVTTPNWSAA